MKRESSPKWSTEYDGTPRRVWPSKCEQCGKIYYVPKHRLKGHRFCSLGCRGFGSRKRVSCTCQECGKVFERQVGHLGSSKSGLYYCSRICKEMAQRIGGDRRIQPAHYGSGRYVNYRKHALRRDGERCIHCDYNEDRRMLDAHHKDGDRSNNKPGNIELVCVWCHALITRGVEVHAWNGALVQR